MSIDWSRFVEIVHAHQTFLLTSHVRPDCDALGSELGLAYVLESLGKRVRIVNADAVPPSLRFIDPHGKVEQLGADVLAELLRDIEVLVVLDTSAWIQLDGMSEVVRNSNAVKVVIDHHVSEDDLGAESFKDPTAEATGRLVVEAAAALGARLSPDAATALFAAVATDTGWFRFSSTTGDTYRTAGALCDAGAVPHAIYQALYEQNTLARVRLMGRILERTETELDGRLVHTSALRTDFEETGALASDTEDVINVTLTIAGTEAAIIFVERPGGGVKVSFRSRGALDCSRLAEQFGGGGHKAAAGASFDLPLEAVKTQVLDAVRAAMR